MKRPHTAYFLDASAIALILRERRREAPRLLRGKATVSLAYYELCNVLWKEAFLLKIISSQVALKTAERLAYILKEMCIQHLSSPKDLREVLSLALRTGLTTYDASYLYMARELGAVLVTEDNDLAKAAHKCGIKAISVSHYLDKLK
ncbi:MAG: hypothetical protein DRN15_10540 [Thermoprotei archaeon]|nr:MAG: hypothetical protein DRM97_07895 [Thermoprotei archaeon]RLF21786.1 MAG: hypothetical protein DRN15_10540 [Thermoprotei archaeon]